MNFLKYKTLQIQIGESYFPLLSACRGEIRFHTNGYFVEYLNGFYSVYEWTPDLNPPVFLQRFSSMQRAKKFIAAKRLVSKVL